MIKIWALLGLAICLEIAGVICLRFSEGFTLIVPTVIAIISFTFALFLVSRAMKKLPVSVAYPVWAGGGTAGVALLGIFALNEDINTMKVLGILIVMTGVILINIASEKKSGC